MMKPTALLLLLALAGLAEAAPTQVTALQGPAWLERGAVKKPLYPGSVLQGDDKLLTGDGGRVLLTLPEGSQVKLGAGAQFVVRDANAEDGKSSPFQSSLEVLKGAFRFTTSLLGKGRNRQVQIRVATVTVGVRGTDLWGRSNDEKDLVCLLEGKIAVSHDSGVQAEMNEPLQFFVAPKGQAPGPVGKVDAGQVEKWAQETELQPGQPSLRADGRYRLLLGAPQKQATALALYDQLRGDGYPVRLAAAGRGQYRVELRQLASRDDARQLGQSLAQRYPQMAFAVR